MTPLKAKPLTSRGPDNIKLMDIRVEDHTTHRLIEEYHEQLHPFLCRHCGYHSLVPSQNEIVVSPDENIQGILQKEFHCSYCGHQEVINVIISSLEQEQAVNF